MNKLKIWLHRVFGKCVPVVSTEVHDVEVFLPSGETHQRKLRVSVVSCDKCGRMMDLAPRGFADQ